MKKRIGFIAMSGVRAHNDELTRLGLTLPGFVERNQVIASLPSLGLLTLASLTPARFEVEYHEIADLKELPELPTHFDLIALSTFTAQLKEAYTVADHYQALEIPVVMDDNTFVHREHSRQLMRALIPERLRWFTETDIRVAEDDELLGLIRDAGCQQVLIGLESPCQTSLDGVELRRNWKLRQVDRYLDAIQKIQARGITVNGCFVLGLDGDTPGVFDDVLKFVRESGLYEVQVTFMTPFPGTPLHQRLQDEGRLLREGAWELCTLFDINIRPKHMSVDELQRGLMRLVKELYSADETARRRTGFRQRLRQSTRTARRQDPMAAKVLAA